MLKLVAPLAIGLGLSLASRFLSPSRNSNRQREKPDYAGSGIGDIYPWVYGITTVGEFVIYKGKVQGSNKGKLQRKGKGNGAYVSAIIGICQGEIGRVTKIFANNKLVWINTPYQTRDFLTNACDRWKIYNGTVDQPIDPLAATVFGASASAYRGLAYMAIEDLNVKDFGDELPNFRFEVERYAKEPASDQFNPSVGCSVYNIPVPPRNQISATPGSAIPNGVNPWNTIPDLYYVNGTTAVVGSNATFPGASPKPSTPQNAMVEFTGDPGQGGFIDVIALANYDNRPIVATDIESMLNLWGVRYESGFITSQQAISAGARVSVVVRQNGNFWQLSAGFGSIEPNNWQTALPATYANYYMVSIAEKLFGAVTANSVEPLFGAPPFVGNFTFSQNFDIGLRYEIQPSGLDPYFSPNSSTLLVGLPTDYTTGGRGIGLQGLLDMASNTIAFRARVVPQRESNWYSGRVDSLSLRIVQMKDDPSEILPLPSSLNGQQILGAYIEYRTAPQVNLGGSTPSDNEGRIGVNTAAGNFPITGWFRRYGQWHHYGATVAPGVTEYAEPMGVTPQLQLVYDGHPELVGVLTGRAPLPPSGSDFYEAPYTSTISAGIDRSSRGAAYARAIPLAEIVQCMVSDYPALGEFVADRGFDYSYGDWNPSLTGRNREIYGYQMRDGAQVWQHAVKLYSLFDLELVDYGARQISVVSVEQSTLVDIPIDWVVRSENDETGNLEHSIEYTSVSYADVPSEVRIQFRDVGRDGEGSIAMAKNNQSFGTVNSTTITTEASMAFVTCQALARRHLYKAMARQFEVRIKLSREAFGRFTIGDRIRIRLPWPEQFDNGWTFDDVRVIRVESIEIDENFVSTITGVLADALERQVPVLPLPPVTPVFDNLPATLYLEAVRLDIPLLGDPSSPLQTNYYGRTNVYQVNGGRIPGYRNEFDGITETQVSIDSSAIAVASMNMTPNFNPLLARPGVRYRTAEIFVNSVEPVHGFQTYTEFQFDTGLGNFLLFQGKIVRAREAVQSGSGYIFRDLIWGLSGTWFNLPPQNDHPLKLGSTYDNEIDSQADIGVSRSIRIYHPVQIPTSSPLAINTQTAFTARPYQPTGILTHVQPDRSTVLTWHGHVLGQGNRVNGRHPSGLPSTNYTLEYAYTPGFPINTITLSTEAFTVPTPPIGATGFFYQVRQNGAFSQVSPAASGVVFY